MALELGFDRFATFSEQNQDQTGTAFFLKPDEVAAQALGPQFANAPALSIDYSTIAAGCDMRMPKDKC
jgi:hypothetical protein